MPGHLNNSQLELLLFPRLTRSSDHGDNCEHVVRASADVVESCASPTPVRYPLNKQLVVFAVRDVLRLCSYIPEHVRSLIEADDDSELRCVAPQVGCVLTDSHPAFCVLIARLILRLTGTALPPSAVDELIAASRSIARHSLNMDTRTRRAYLSELYMPGSDNVSLSSQVRATSAAFRELQERRWFTGGHNPLQQLRLTYPIQTLQRVGRMPCPTCTRKSACAHTDEV